MEAIGYNAEMIVVSTQLSDWQETSAAQAFAHDEGVMGWLFGEHSVKEANR